jgi:hypothetical protein
VARPHLWNKGTVYTLPGKLVGAVEWGAGIDLEASRIQQDRTSLSVSLGLQLSFVLVWPCCVVWCFSVNVLCCSVFQRDSVVLFGVLVLTSCVVRCFSVTVLC